MQKFFKCDHIRFLIRLRMTLFGEKLVLFYQCGWRSYFRPRFRDLNSAGILIMDLYREFWRLVAAKSDAPQTT